MKHSKGRSTDPEVVISRKGVYTGGLTVIEASEIDLDIEDYSFKETDTFEIEDRWWQFHCKTLLLTRMVALRFPLHSDAELRETERRQMITIKVAEQQYRNFWQMRDLTPKLIKALPKDDEIRRQFYRLKGKILDLRATRERVLECLHARHLLRSRTDYLMDIARVLKAHGKRVRGVKN